MLACIAPHVGEEIWEKLGHQNVIAYEKWPAFEEDKLVKNTVQIAIQVNGKLRGTIETNLDTSDEDLKKLAFEQEGVKKHIEGKEIKKIIIVKNKIVNIVAI